MFIPGSKLASISASTGCTVSSSNAYSLINPSDETYNSNIRVNSNSNLSQSLIPATPDHTPGVVFLTKEANTTYGKGAVITVTAGAGATPLLMLRILGSTSGAYIEES